MAESHQHCALLNALMAVCTRTRSALHFRLKSSILRSKPARLLLVQFTCSADCLRQCICRHPATCCCLDLQMQCSPRHHQQLQVFVSPMRGQKIKQARAYCGQGRNHAQGFELPCRLLAFQPSLWPLRSRPLPSAPASWSPVCSLRAARRARTCR